MRGYHILISVQRQQDSFIPSHLFHSLPSHKPKPTFRQNALFNPTNKDYRFGPIRLDWFDFERTPYTAMGKVREQGRGSFFSMSHIPIVYPLQKLYLFLTPAQNQGLRTSQQEWSMYLETKPVNLPKKNSSQLLPHLLPFMMIRMEQCWVSWQCHLG